jgi:hypothetical protein
MNKLSAQEEFTKEVKTFLSEKNEYSPNSNATVFAFELITNNSISNHSCGCGIFRIGVFSDHGLFYLMLVDKELNTLTFLDFDNLSISLTTIIEFLENSSCNFSEGQILKYIKETIKLYNINLNRSPW